MAQLRKRPTMDDVARAAGVSKATISRVLSGVEGGCSPATAAHVRETAEQLGYVINSVAASLRNRRTRTVGLVIADISNPFFGAITSGVETSLADAGYSVILANTGNVAERERSLVQLLVEKQVDGIILAPSGSSGDHVLSAVRQGAPVVLVDSSIPDLAVDCIGIDNRQSGIEGTDHLIACGHRRIAIVTGPLTADFDRQRLDGYKAALAKAGITPDERYILSEDLLTPGGEHAVARLLELEDRPTGLFVLNNMMTLGVLMGLQKAGLRIPDDISVVAFDDQEWYSVTAPSITAIANPAHEMGRRAGELMLLRLQKGDDDLPVQDVRLRSRLVLRKSTAKP